MAWEGEVTGNHDHECWNGIGLIKLGMVTTPATVSYLYHPLTEIIVFGSLDTFCVCLSIVYFFVLFAR